MEKELYSWPVSEEGLEGFSPFESPAHRGIEALANACDFIIPINTDVLAMIDGCVTYVKQDSQEGGNDLDGLGDVRKSKYWDKGNRIEILHGDEIYTGYEHLEYGSSLVSVGDKVRKGQRIAKTGYTGFMAHLGPHLHAERFVYTGEGGEDYFCLPICFEKEILLFTKYFWGSEKWGQIGNSRQINHEQSHNKKG